MLELVLVVGGHWGISHTWGIVFLLPPCCAGRRAHLSDLLPRGQQHGASEAALEHLPKPLFLCQDFNSGWFE